MSDDPVEEIRDLGAGVKAEFLSRLRSPLVGAFVISWLLWNHRVLFVLFSDMKVGKRFDFIDTDLFSSSADFWLWNTVWPLLSAVGYIFIVPLATRGVHRWNLWQRRLLREDDLRSERLEVIPVAEAKKLKLLLEGRRSQIEVFKSDMEKLRLRVVQLAAMHACAKNREAEREHQELREYLTSRSFIMWKVAGTTALSRHSFGTDAGIISVALQKRTGAADADGWNLVATKLQLLVKDDVLFQLAFDYEDGSFRGICDGIDVRLAPVA